MIERDLENLNDLPVPAPRDAAKRAAMEAAMVAFDASANKLPDGAPQGNVVPLRQTETSTAKRSFLMRLYSRPAMAIAASLTALMIAAPIAFRQGGLRVSDYGLQGRAPAPTDAERFPQKNVVSENKPKSEILSAAPEKKTADEKAQAPSYGQLSRGDKQAHEEIGGTVTNTQPVDAAPPPPQSQSGPADGLAAAGKTEVTIAAQPVPAPTAAPPAIPMPAFNGLSRSYVNEVPALAKRRQSSGIGLAEGGEYAPASPAQPYGWMGDADTQRITAVELENRDKFENKEVNPVKQVASEPISTFSIDVDTASYSFVRRALNAGQLPPKDAVRVEEMINYFPYAYPAPETSEVPFKPAVTVVPSPWNTSNQLVHIAIKGYDLKNTERPRANLVLLMDVSGSMEPQDRLPLIKNAFRLLVDELKPDDTVAIVTYASGSGVALEPTKVSDKSKILRALESLGAGGSTAGAAGIADAYRLAERGFDKGAVNRVILATDGDFNVGITDQNELKGFIERKRQSGIFLSILGVGQGNHNDALMQTLAQNGNGTAAYVDTLSEARKVLVDESSSTLFTIAKDVKIQVEWNPQRVAEYRLVGYETRALKREDFNNDKVDAGDIGSGHTVTAIYEVTPVGAAVTADELRYGQKTATAAPSPVMRESDGASQQKMSELGFLKLRYKRPNEDVSKLIELPIPAANSNAGINSASAEARFSIAVAGFGQLLRGAPYTQNFSYDDVLALAQTARGDDAFGYRAEFLNLVRLAKSAQP